MKKRKNIIFAFLLFASLTLGVGYAALSESLDVWGNLGTNIDNTNLVMEYTEANVDGTYCTQADIAAKTSAKLTFGSMTKVNQLAWVVLKVQNNSSNVSGVEELTAKLHNINVVLTESQDDFFTVETKFASAYAGKADDGTANYTEWGAGDVILAPAESCYFYVGIKLKQTPTNALTAERFEVTFQATTVESTQNI